MLKTPSSRNARRFNNKTKTAAQRVVSLTDSGTRSPMTQANQAAMLLEAYNQSCVNEPWREVVIFYTWANRQPEGSTDVTEDAFGVVDARTASTSFGAKPALATVTTLKRGT